MKEHWLVECLVGEMVVVLAALMAGKKGLM
jgi:hypothetical protein